VAVVVRIRNREITGVVWRASVRKSMPVKSSVVFSGFGVPRVIA
jgi:hypothetical protein